MNLKIKHWYCPNCGNMLVGLADKGYLKCICPNCNVEMQYTKKNRREIVIRMFNSKSVYN